MKIIKDMFMDVEFMSAEDKYKVAKLFQRFVKNGFQRKDFKDRVYKHLSLHCGFIAHYNIDGFYTTYFDRFKEDLKDFVERFLNFDNVMDEDKYNRLNVNGGYYGDINKVIADILLENNVKEKVI